MKSTFDPTIEPIADIAELLPRFGADGTWAVSVPRVDLTSVTPAQIRQAMIALPEPYRGVVLLHDSGLISIVGLASALDLETTAVRVILHRGRMALACLLS